jgi:hypothetical protein
MITDIVRRRRKRSRWVDWFQSDGSSTIFESIEVFGPLVRLERPFGPETQGFRLFVLVLRRKPVLVLDVIAVHSSTITSTISLSTSTIGCIT